MAIIETAGALRPGTTNTPLDQRARVNTLAEISTLSLPYLGQIVYCVETGRYYKVTSLKSTQVGALTVADAAVDTYEELPVTPAELQTLIVAQVTNNPSILTFLEELIAARIADSGGSGTEDPDDTEDLPYTYPEGVAANYLVVTIPGEAEFAQSDGTFGDRTIGVAAYAGETQVSVLASSYDGLSSVNAPFALGTAGSRAIIFLSDSTPTGELTVKFTNCLSGTIEQTVNYTGHHIPQYFARPAGEGNWQLKINGTAVEAEYWTGSAWVDFPADGMGADLAGKYYRTKTAPSYPAIACWSNGGTDGDFFLYLV